MIEEGFHLNQEGHERISERMMLSILEAQVENYRVLLQRAAEAIWEWHKFPYTQCGKTGKVTGYNVNGWAKAMLDELAANGIVPAEQDKVDGV